MHDICLSRQADDSPAPHVDKRRHLANPPSPVYIVCVWPKSLKVKSADSSVAGRPWDDH